MSGRADPGARAPRSALHVLCVDLDPLPAARPWLSLTAVTSAGLGSAPGEADAVVLGEAALSSLPPPQQVPASWIGCVRGVPPPEVRLWMGAGLTRIVAPAALLAVLSRELTSPAAAPSSTADLVLRRAPEVRRVLALAAGPALTRDVAAWSRLAGRDVRSLERLLRRNGLPPPKRLLSEIAEVAIRRRRAQGVTWAEIALEFDFHDDSCVHRFLRRRRDKPGERA